MGVWREEGDVLCGKAVTAMWVFGERREMCCVVKRLLPCGCLEIGGRCAVW